MLASTRVNVDHSRFTAGFSVMRLKWKNGCAGTERNLPILPSQVDEPLRCPQWPLGVGRRQVESDRSRNCRFLSVQIGPSTAKVSSGRQILETTPKNQAALRSSGRSTGPKCARRMVAKMPRSPAFLKREGDRIATMTS